MGFFDKYQDALTPKPNGRPVGVLNGQGQQPTTAGNPALSGLAQAVNGAQGILSTAKAPQVVKQPALANKSQGANEWNQKSKAIKAWSGLF